MKIRDQKRDKQQRQAPAALEEARLVVVRGGLKAERVQGPDPTGPGGD